jgi:hypothetical protein
MHGSSAKRKLSRVQITVLAAIVLLYSVGAYAETKLAPLPDAWCTLRLRSTKTGNAEVQWLSWLESRSRIGGRHRDPYAFLSI